MHVILTFVDGYVEKLDGLIYILEWTSSHTEPFSFLPMGQKAFEFRECEYRNCFITDDAKYLRRLTDFDVLMFIAKSIKEDAFIFPRKRSVRQKYVFVSMESAANYPTSTEFNDFFNLTWTYRLDSDAPLNFIVVKDENGDIIGPKQVVNWNATIVGPIRNFVKDKLKNKRVAATWFVSNCNTSNHRMEFVTALQKHLAAHGHQVDIYGRCGNQTCPQNEPKCDELVESDYYFYLAFENSFAEDYVTEKVLHALNHFAVPIVFGTADYRRFMPDGIYLDARQLGPYDLSLKMVNAIKNSSEYHDYFRWHSSYSFHNTLESGLTNEFCALCALVNENKTKSYTDFVQWWNK